MRQVPPERLVKDVGRRIGELRSDVGVTQAELAEKIGVATRYVQSVEGGGENLTLTTIAKFAIALGVPAASFFERPARPKPRPGRPKKSTA
ncbi:MAG: helix-turn-helix transcriptional regulator [Polyangiaceae bacterium]